MIYDCILIGGGPASLSAAVYLGRASYKIAFIENKAPGGKVVNTGDVKNYLGYKSLPGPDLAFQFFDHAVKSGAVYLGEKAIKIIKNSDFTFKIITDINEHYTKSIVIATGTNEGKLNVPGEKEYESKGVSKCAICDAPLYKNRTMAFIGGGNAAIGEALHVMNFAQKIILIHRRDFFRADKSLVKKLFSIKKVHKYIPYEVVEIKGHKGYVNKIVIKNINTKKLETLEVDVIFPYIGSIPNIDILKNSQLEYLLSKTNYIITNQKLETKERGIFAAGDVVEKEMRQIATAVGDGALVSRSVIAYLEE